MLGILKTASGGCEKCVFNNIDILNDSAFNCDAPSAIRNRCALEMYWYLGYLGDEDFTDKKHKQIMEVCKCQKERITQ